MTVVLDNEAVQALRMPGHKKHRRALSHIQVVAARKRKGSGAISLVVPTAVRVEAGWDRTEPRSAFINLLGIRDAALDEKAADRAAALAHEHRVSVADAHIGAVIRHLPARPVTVITSDAKDVRLVAGSVPVNIVSL